MYIHTFCKRVFESVFSLSVSLTLLITVCFRILVLMLFLRSNFSDQISTIASLGLRKDY